MEISSSCRIYNDNTQADAANQILDSVAGPLQGVVACLSGQDQHKKEELHMLILSLGGRYTRDLNLDKNTHLITEEAQGEKYKLVVSSDPQIVHIVRQSWLNSTLQTGKRPCEENHKLELLLSGTGGTNNNRCNGNQNLQVNDSKPSIISLVNDALSDPALKMMRINGNVNNHSSSHSSIFEKLQFYLVGFESDTELKQKISKLIRRGNGTIYWEMNEEISILLVSNMCDDTLLNAAKVVSLHHSKLPPTISPTWVIDSYKQNRLQAPEAYQPIPSASVAVPLKNHNNERMKSYTKKDAAKSSLSKTSLSSTTSNFSIFRGCLFSLVRSPSLNDLELTGEKGKQNKNVNVDFDIDEQETFIKAHGGEILSMKLLDALQADMKNIGTNGSTTTMAKITERNKRSSTAAAAAAAAATTSRRKCHIVCWGKCPPRLDTNPLVSQLQRHDLCELVLVTPIWVQACVSVKKCIRPERMPLVLIPQSWSMISFSDVRNFQISLTGFQGTEKAVIIHLIEVIGGVYHNNMSNINTHLVFKKNATGLKLQKANEWGLNVVSIQWLYHVLEHGYNGLHNEENGCEKRFSLGTGI